MRTSRSQELLGLESGDFVIFGFFIIQYIEIMKVWIDQDSLVTFIGEILDEIW